MAKRNSSRPSRRTITSDLSVRGRVTDLLEGRATPPELIAEGVLVDLTTGPTAKAWSDASPGLLPVFVTRGAWDIVQRAVQHPDSRTSLDTVVYELLWMSQPKPDDIKLMLAVALTGTPFPNAHETCNAVLDTRVMELRRRYPEERVFVCWIPTNPRSEFESVADTHIFRMAFGFAEDGGMPFYIIMTADGD